VWGHINKALGQPLLRISLIEDWGGGGGLAPLHDMLFARDTGNFVSIAGQGRCVHVDGNEQISRI
jgi:hypothetical protein